MHKADVIVVGGGIVGLATAWQLQNRKPDVQVIVLEKEAAVGQHQTGHNSGVLHTGVYYKPGSLKAKNCTEGRRSMVEFCQQHGIAHEICGKVVVATHASELDRLGNLFERAQANGVKCEMIEPGRLAEIEPHVSGVRAMHVPEAGIADYPAVVRKLTELIRERDGQVLTGTRVTGIREDGDGVVISTPSGEFRGDRGVNCAGLHSDRITRLAGHTPPARIVPFRGEYYKFKPGTPKLCNHLIYPVPDPAFPFLGVHFTRMVDGAIEAGPNAVLAFAREGYKMTDIHLGDLLGTLTYGGFLRIAMKYWRTGAGEMWRSVSKRAFVHALQRLVPEVRAEHLEPAPAGVRAQAIASDGSMVDDFLIEESERFLHVCNAPSPAATAALNIGATLAARLG